MDSETQKRVYHLLQRMPCDGLDAAKQLFWTELNYDSVNEPLSYREWPERAQEALDDVPLLLAEYESQFGSFGIIYCRLSTEQRGRDFPLSLTAERLVINQLLTDHPYALFVFSDTEERYWHLVNAKYERAPARPSSAGSRAPRQVLRRIAVGPYERLRTAAERVSMLDLSTLSSDLFGLSPIAIQQRHDEAFDVEAVTARFFQEYQQVFARLQDDLRRQTGDERWAHDYALQFLNRLMFLYYVQRKRWLGDDPDFVTSLWNAYRQAGRPTDTFFGEWLSMLFFEAFNKQFQAGRADRQYLPEAIRNALALAPFLNGGLFVPNELDRRHQPVISDERLAHILAFLDGYNFTISEDTPLDQEVAVDPEMIGKVYESLVNVSEEIDERGAAGIFYTPRVEIDLMCRLSLVHWLVNQFGEEHKSLLYEVVFAFDPEDKEQADAALAELNLWPRFYELLCSLIALDLACGSGSFLVGMLYVLDDLMARANHQLGYEQTPYERKKRIIGQNLYGVDVMDWAVHVAELRLWLQLVIDTDLAPAELQFRPLLPNLSFKIRCGDSLVQEVGGIDMALRQGSRLIPPHLKGRITQLKAEKLKFYNNDPDCKYRNVQAVQLTELGLFRDILEARAKAVDDRIRHIEDTLRPQVNLFGEMQTTQLGLERASLEQELERLQADREQAVRARDALRTAKDVPFVWDIAFVEIFAGDRSGCDIVIGNPPYVRQELIHDPRQPADEVTTGDKRAYKDKLARSVYTAWPLTFGYNWTTGKPRWKLDAKSDLYIYFYLRGLSLLNDKGTFCFITSNSWLDVGYGRDLQEFLLTRGQVRLVIDNQARRSFASADVNTVIVLLGAAHDTKRQREESLCRVARFAMFKVPFEHVLHPVIWQEIEEAPQRVSLLEYRISPLSQAELLQHGMDPEKGTFAGDKWGGKYLRAPDIYWTILEKSKGKLTRLGDVAEVRFGIKTGANEFFYLDEQSIAKWGIEEQFLMPVIKSPRECKGLVIDPSKLRYRLFMCNLPFARLEGTAAGAYIKWGESQGFHRRPSVHGRTPWYDLGERAIPPFVSPSSFSDFFRVFENGRVFIDKRMYEIYPRFSKDRALVILNTTLCTLFLEIASRTGLGQGLVDLTVYEVADCLVINPKYSIDFDESSLKALKNRDVLPITKEIKQPDRLNLDTSVFDILGLTRLERDETYAAVLDLVSARLNKATSV